LAAYESWGIAGYSLGGDWYDVENGDVDIAQNEEALLAEIPEMVVRIEYADGETEYTTMWGPWEGWDELYEYIEWYVENGSPGGGE
jgi:hypothetical protein